MTIPAIGDEVYLKGESNRDGSVRLLYGADIDGDGVPDATQQHRVDGRWVEMSASPAAVQTQAAAASTTVTPADGDYSLIAQGGKLYRVLHSALTSKWLGALTGEVARSLGLKLRERKTFDDFGAAGDGTTDDTTAIQAAITATIALGGGTFLYGVPGKTYKITAPLEMPGGAIKHWELDLKQSTIVQATDNTPILRFSTPGPGRFVIRNGLLKHANVQTGNPSAIGIHFTTTLADGTGYFNFLLDTLTFDNSYYGILNRQDVACPLWGYKFHNLNFLQSRTGPAIDVRASAAGQPASVIDKVYVRCDGGSNSIVQIYCAGYDNLKIRDVEFNKLTRFNCMTVENSRGTGIRGVRFESNALAGSLATGGQGGIEIAGGSATIDDCSWSNMVLAHTGNYQYLVRVTSTGVARVGQLTTNSDVTFSSSGALAAINNAAGTVTFQGPLYKSGATVTDIYQFDASITRTRKPCGMTTDQITVADQATSTISLNPDITVGYLAVTVQALAAHCALVFFDCGTTPAATIVQGGANFAVTTVDVVGSTGTNGNTTLSIRNGVIEIENRSGGSRNYRFAFLTAWV